MDFKFEYWLLSAFIAMAVAVVAVLGLGTIFI